MYNTSESYKQAVKGNLLKSRIEGTITLQDDTVIPFTEKDIVPGSMSVNNKCVNSSSFNLGSVYIGELSLTLLKTVDRYALYNAGVKFSYYQALEDGREEKILMGVYHVYEPTRTKRMIALKCYDNMKKFDVSVADNTVGTPFEILSYMCGICGVEMEQTEEEISALCNGTQIFSVMADKVDTYRDVLSYVASMIGCFATINREGKLLLVNFMTSPVAAISSKKRMQSTIADYQTYFCGVRARFIADQNLYPYSVTDDTITDGLVLDMGDIPIVYGTEVVKKEMLQNILSVLKEIRYVPTDFSIPGDPSIELGDMITLEKVNSTEQSVNTIVTSFTWTYHSGHKIKSSGDNTRLYGVKTKEQKEIDYIESMVSEKDIITHSYTNASQIVLNSEKEKEIISFKYAATKDTRTVFIATVPFVMDRDGYIVINYYLDGLLLENDTLRQYVDIGAHFITISNNLAIEQNTRAELSVRAKTEYMESDLRQHSAKISSILDYISTGTYTEQAVDTTAPGATIAKQAIKAVLYAQGLSGVKEWDGTITILEDMHRLQLAPLGIRTFAEHATAEMQIPIGGIVTQAIGSLQLDPLVLRGFTEEIGSGEIIEFVVTQQKVEFAGTDYTETVDGVTKLRTEYVVESVTEEIDEGYMSSVEIVTDGYQSVESVVIENV